MIDLHSYEMVKLEDVADFERARKGHVYPHGSSTIQISASRGQIGYLQEARKVATKDVVVTPQAGINPRYFNFILQKNIDQFMAKYATGINVQENEIGKFPIELHNKETQDQVMHLVKFIEDETLTVQDNISALKQMKSKMLDEMMC